MKERLGSRRVIKDVETSALVQSIWRILWQDFCSIVDVLLFYSLLVLFPSFIRLVLFVWLLQARILENWLQTQVDLILQCLLDLAAGMGIEKITWRNLAEGLGNCPNQHIRYVSRVKLKQQFPYHGKASLQREHPAVKKKCCCLPFPNLRKSSFTVHGFTQPRWLLRLSSLLNFRHISPSNRDRSYAIGVGRERLYREV